MYLSCVYRQQYTTNEGAEEDDEDEALWISL